MDHVEREESGGRVCEGCHKTDHCRDPKRCACWCTREENGLRYSMKLWRWLADDDRLIEAIYITSIIPGTAVIQDQEPLETFQDWCWWAYIASWMDAVPGTAPAFDYIRNEWTRRVMRWP